MSFLNKKIIFLNLGIFFILGFTYSLLEKQAYLPPLLSLPAVLNSQHSSYHQPLPVTESINQNQPLNKLLKLEDIDKSKLSILVEKPLYRLTVYYDKKPIKTYPIVLGFNPVDDKRKEGDRRTPEGLFKIQEYYPHPEWSKFLWLDYPNNYSWQKHLQAKFKGEIKWQDSVGSEIGIHGHPAGADDLIKNRQNWTFGCVSLRNQDIEEIYPFIQRHTLVEII